MSRARTRDQKSHIISELHDGNILLDDREIFLHPYYSGGDKTDTDTDFRMSTTFIKNLRLLLTHDKTQIDVPILIHMYNSGGHWGPGMAVYDAIEGCPTYITALIHGEACSMGSIIPLAADRVIMMPNAMWMVHDGNTGINTDMTTKQSRSWVKMEQLCTDRMFDIYVKNCKKGPIFKERKEGEIRRYIKKKFDETEDWFLTSEEAVEYGFAHGILGEGEFDTIEKIKKH